jgi:tetratricopeptide (TPR) repeat protein
MVAASLAVLPRPQAGEADPLAELPGRLERMAPLEQIAYLDSLLESGLEDARIHFFLGNSYFAAEQPDSAIAQYHRAVDLDEDYAKAFVNMGIVYDSRRKRQQARTAYSRAIQINPEDVLAYCHLGYNYYVSGEHDTAMDYYSHALDIDPNSAQAHYNMGLAFANAKIFKEALVEWRKVVELDPDGSLGKMASENVDLILEYMELGK